MTEDDYSEFVMKLCKPGSQVLKEMNQETAHLLHMAVGISGEAGELLDAVKKAAVYCKDLDLEHVKEELGDLEFYMQGLRTTLGITRNEVLQKNQNKLYQRYFGKKFSNEHAQERRDKL
jgi:NTP pyrophosphatase (non-canonical NTP hydrolase)